MTSAWKKWAGAVALAACALAGATVAFGAGTTKQAANATTTTTGSTTTTRSGPVPETELTGDGVAKAGGTADRATTETDNSNSAAVYEVHVTKADGSHVVVILDKDYAVLMVETQAAGPATHGLRRR